MKYWVYINEKVDGPYDGEKLVTLQGFTPDTLICSEEAASSGNQQWVKASSVFEFEQEPTADQNSAQNGGLDAASAAILLEKLDLLTKEITDLHSKLDNMETHIDKAFEEARVQQQAAIQAAAPATVTPAEEKKPETTETVGAEENQAPQPAETPAPETQTQTAEPAKEENTLDGLDNMQTPALAGDDMLEEKTSAEEELVIRSALDSLYNAKLLDEQDTKENTFQDLLTPQQAKDLSKETDKAQPAEEPAAAEKPAEVPATEEALPAAEEPAVEETVAAEEPAAMEEPAVEKTVAAEEPAAAEEPSAEEKEEFVDTFNQSSAQQSESALDQLIKEKQEEQQKENADIAPLAAAAVAGAAAAAGLATLGDDSEKQTTEEAPAFIPLEELEEGKKSLDLTPQDDLLEIAPDKNEPSHLETVLPAEEMPQDNPQPDIVPMAPSADLPSVQDEALPAIAPEQEPEPFIETPAMESLDSNNGFAERQTESEDENEGTLQELVPGAKTEPPSDQIITEEDLRDAFTERVPAPGSEVSPFDEFPVDDVATPVAETTEEMKNPNELTEVELKAGSTYLISDFVPPEQSPSDMPAPVKQEEPIVEDKTIEIQDMLTANSEPTPDNDIANTLKTAKRGASFDIKTVPMVQDPAQSERLQIDGFDDVNAQHDIKTADTKSSGATKVVMGTLVTLILVAVLYVLLAFMHIIPQQFNVLFKQKAPAAATAPAAQMTEMLPSSTPDSTENVTEVTTETSTEETAAEPEQDNMDDVLSEVQQFILPNGQSLQSLIETKHAGISPELITWDITTAVEPDNYSILVKVPPENPQSYKTSYRFNYNAVTKTLDPTISDAKNLLESAN